MKLKISCFLPPGLLLLTVWMLLFVSCDRDNARLSVMSDFPGESHGKSGREIISEARKIMYCDSTWPQAATMLNEVAARYYISPEDTSVRNAAVEALRLLGCIQMEYDYDYDKAYRNLSTARMIAEEDGNDFQNAFISGQLAALYYWAADGDPEVERQSYEILQQAIDFALKSDNQAAMLTAALNMTVVTLDNDSIWPRFKPSAVSILNYPFSDRYAGRAEIIKHMVRGRCCYLDSNPVQAENEFNKAYLLADYTSSGNRLSYTIDSFLYELYISEKKYAQARRMLERSLDNALRLNHLDYQLSLYKKKSNFHMLVNEKDSVEKYHHKYLDLKFRFQDFDGYGRIKEYAFLDKIDSINSEVRSLSLKAQREKQKRTVVYFILIIVSLTLCFALYTLYTLHRRNRLLFSKNVEMGEREKQNRLLRESLENEIRRIKERESQTAETRVSRPASDQGEKNKTEELTEIYTAVLSFMETSDVIYQAGFSLTELASIMHMPERTISKAINTCHNSNFHQLLNEYRIRKVTAMMGSDAAQSLTIESIAAQAGFKSRPHFIQVFKRIVGMSPSEYMKLSAERFSGHNKL